MENIFRRKTIGEYQAQRRHGKLAATLSWPHLVMLGIGGIVGTGIYTLIGVASDRAGPAILLSFVIAGVISACAALAYAELATVIPVAGGAYTYSYAALGEMLAWIVGWSLILEYTLVVSTVAVGWSAYATGFLAGLGIDIPFFLTAGMHAIDAPSVAHQAVYLLPGLHSNVLENIDSIVVHHGLINLPAIFIVFVVAAMLLVGTKESAVVNAILVVVKIAALILFVVIALPHFKVENLSPFMPFGFTKALYPDGIERGVMAATAIIFFAFYGFDIIATAAEETKKPNRDLSIGILGSLIGSIAIYVFVGLAAIGAVHFAIFSKSGEPLALILRDIGAGGYASIIGAAAIIALPTVLLAFFYGQTRIFFVMGRDRLLPKMLSNVHEKKGTPVVTTLITACIIAFAAGTLRLDEIAALSNAGTLCAFTAVGICLVVLRVREPNIERKFKTPAVWLVAPLCVLGCIYLFSSLPVQTQKYFLIWNIIGFIAYFCYGFWHSAMRQNRP